MGKKLKRDSKGKSFPKGTIMVIAGIAAVAAIGGFFWYNSLIPANGTTPIFSPSTNVYVKALRSDQAGYVFASQSVRSGKKSVGGSTADPTIDLIKGELATIHVINQDSETQSKHNFNIDAFKVHTKDLNYFEAQSITFIADQTGSFPYYCTIHPEMKGTIVVSEG